MIKMMFCLRRRPDLDRERFQHYWLEEHAPRVAALAAETGMVRYVQCHTIDSALGRAATKARGGAPAYDGVMEGWWPSEEAALAALGERGRLAGAALLADERHFIDLAASSLFVTRERTIY